MSRSDRKAAFPAVWSDDDWLKKFSGKTVEEAEAEAAAGETAKTTAQEVRGSYCCCVYSWGLGSERVQIWSVNLSLQDEPPAKKGRVNPQVYMDIKIGNKPAGRLRFLLRADIVPMTAGVYVCMLHITTFIP